MKEKDRIFIALYDFIMFELTRREEELSSARDVYGSSRNVRDMFPVVVAWVKYEYFRSWYAELIEYLRSFDR